MRYYVAKSVKFSLFFQDVGTVRVRKKVPDTFGEVTA
jgi:hypothetical protein